MAEKVSDAEKAEAARVASEDAKAKSARKIEVDRRAAFKAQQDATKTRVPGLVRSI